MKEIRDVLKRAMEIYKRSPLFEAKLPRNRFLEKNGARMSQHYG